MNLIKEEILKMNSKLNNLEVSEEVRGPSLRLALVEAFGLGETSFFKRLLNGNESATPEDLTRALEMEAKRLKENYPSVEFLYSTHWAAIVTEHGAIRGWYRDSDTYEYFLAF